MRLIPKALFLLTAAVSLLPAQSTFGSIVGTVTDPSGAVIPGARVTVTNLGENTSVSVQTNPQGNYEALNLKAGVYGVTIEAPGFKAFQVAEVPLAARQVVRVNATLEVGSVAESLTVQAIAPVITTDTQTVASSLDTRMVLELPLNYRGAGSTSPYRVLAFLPGVQSDDNFNYAVQGAVPAQTEVTLDGISTVNVTGHSPLPEVYPSAEGIAEMKVQGVGGNAEFGQIADITTTSRGGSNEFHGSLFEYLQNRALDATPFGATSKPPKVANTFGGSVGGRLIRNRTFFFTTYEDMRYRRSSALQATVPTAAMRAGDFSKESVSLRDPFTGQPLPGNQIPASQIVGVARKVMEFYPLPNFGPAEVQRSANFRKNEAAPITSRQFDLRLDHVLTEKQSLFGRVSQKNVSTISPTWQLLPADTTTLRARNFVLSHSYTIRPNLLNEFRFGFTRNDSALNYHFDGWKITAEMGLRGLPDLPYNGLPAFAFSQGTSGFGKSKPDFHKSHLYQWNDNLTLVHGRHTFKFGGDVRRIRARSALSFGLNHGQFNFDGRFSRHDVADFLMGLPFQSRYADSRINNDGSTAHYALFAQDSFKVTSRLTLEYGLRWEYHPAYRDANGNITNFDRTVPVTGRVIIPSGRRAREITYPGFLLSINACPAPDWNGIPCTPFLQADQVGWPDSLRFAQKDGLAPRFGFAWRPFDNTKTAIRGGVGRYFMVPLGSFYYGLTAIHASGVQEFNNSITAGTPAFRLPQISPGGSGVRVAGYGNAYFGTAEDPYYPDPFAIQWHLTVERDLGWDTGRAPLLHRTALHPAALGARSQPALAFHRPLRPAPAHRSSLPVLGPRLQLRHRRQHGLQRRTGRSDSPLPQRHQLQLRLDLGQAPERRRPRAHGLRRRNRQRPRDRLAQPSLQSRQRFAHAPPSLDHQRHLRAALRQGPPLHVQRSSRPAGTRRRLAHQLHPAASDRPLPDRRLHRRRSLGHQRPGARLPATRRRPLGQPRRSHRRSLVGPRGLRLPRSPARLP